MHTVYSQRVEVARVEAALTALVEAVNRLESFATEPLDKWTMLDEVWNGSSQFYDLPKGGLRS
jgi:hypothetical protein